ncbi:hypothetical protein PF010_g3640 [Phytophthora fragariae]|uniref:Uncharacterized protein n=2 Tax=Phytophthora fragariae TaxID=53985 RepID=A0A6A3UKL4_9STRA|nr:hypothetical protein PF003_g19261 [Phytophthora fragariae]KAE8945627.1 hypothetical protein PF009_g4723 [Phytophthora fragariae]KAE9024774.1 hypothetical protein PF011_g3338 [Phytophthora fragariae]KAE9130834.1 hypothetical protein PF007_g4342 [Phytophthora fragariae]KAE9131009.1 hypothetical protein PF010_g3640 [Phytophthora fragariae]
MKSRMKQKRSANDAAGKASTGKYKCNTCIPWDADNATPNGLSSLRVLLQWICTPGNFAGWHKGGKSRSDAVKSILASMEEHGISHRTTRGVSQKMAKIVQQYLAALEILVDKDLLSAYVGREDIDERVEAKIRHHCPHYHILAPVLNNFSFCGKTPKEWTAGNDSEDTDDADEQQETRATKRKGNTSVGQRSSKRRCTPHSVVEEQLLDNSEEIQTSGDQDNDTDYSMAECTDLVPVPSRDEQSPEFRCKAEECKLQYVQKLTHRLLVHEREKHECGLKAEQYRVELEKRRGEMLLKVDTMLSRQVLKDRRVPKAEIDQVLPLPEP